MVTIGDYFFCLDEAAVFFVHALIILVPMALFACAIGLIKGLISYVCNR